VHLDLIDKHTEAIAALTERIEVVIEPFQGVPRPDLHHPRDQHSDRRRDRRRRTDAIWRKAEADRVVFHTDRGSTSSHQLERELRRHGALASMGSVADCFDNALAESVFATLECELFDKQPRGRFTTHHDAKLAIFDYLEAFYNPPSAFRRRPGCPGRLRGQHLTQSSAA
jgi:transposase InsO family protein